MLWNFRTNFSNQIYKDLSGKRKKIKMIDFAVQVGSIYQNTPKKARKMIFFPRKKNTSVLKKKTCNTFDQLLIVLFNISLG